MKKWGVFLACLGCYLHAEEMKETLYSDWQQTFHIDSILHEEHTEYQDLMIFENRMWGRVLALDGVIQLTEKDEFVYHEMMAHVPLIAHGCAESVLVVGGGDGGVIREVLKHRSVKRVVLVEIDPAVIEFSKKHLPFICQGSLDDPRVEVVIQDGMEFVKNTKEKFDVILCDSADPIGPAAVLFTEPFFRECKRILNPKGIFVNQSGVPAVQKEELPLVYRNLTPHFKHVTFYLVVIPTYVGGFMAFGWASDELDYKKIPLQELCKRREGIQGELKYYNPEMHQASFALPDFIKNNL